jgi:acetyl esterase/lipase
MLPQATITLFTARSLEARMTRIHCPWRTTALLLLMACLWLDPAAAQQQQYSVRSGIVYSASNQQLDLYLPALPRKRTALLLIHGGGFREGSKEQMASLCGLYARAGFVAATINYRLAPTHPFPAAFNDATRAVAWLREQAATQGFDSRKIVVIGYSAGANLALMVGLADGSGVAGIVSAAAPSDLAALLAQTPLAKLKSDLREYLGAAPAEQASPLGRVSPGDPGVFLFHGDRDLLIPVSQSLVLAQRLQANNVPVLLRVFQNAGHEIMLPDTPLLPNPNYEPLVLDMTRFIVAIELRP